MTRATHRQKIEGYCGHFYYFRGKTMFTRHFKPTRRTWNRVSLRFKSVLYFWSDLLILLYIDALRDIVLQCTSIVFMQKEKPEYVPTKASKHQVTDEGILVFQKPVLRWPELCDMVHYPAVRRWSTVLIKGRTRSVITLRKAAVFEPCPIGTTGPKVCQENRVTLWIARLFLVCNGYLTILGKT